MVTLEVGTREGPPAAYFPTTSFDPSHGIWVRPRRSKTCDDFFRKHGGRKRKMIVGGSENRFIPKGVYRVFKSYFKPLRLALWRAALPRRQLPRVDHPRKSFASEVRFSYRYAIHMYNRIPRIFLPK